MISNEIARRDTMTEQELKQIGTRLRSKRKDLGLTRVQLAHLAGVSPGFYGQLEVGGSQMSLDTLIKLSKSLHVSTEYLLFGEPEDSIDKTSHPAIHLLQQCSERELYLAYDVLKLFLMKQ